MLSVPEFLASESLTCPRKGTPSTRGPNRSVSPMQNWGAAIWPEHGSPIGGDWLADEVLAGRVCRRCTHCIRVNHTSERPSPLESPCYGE